MSASIVLPDLRFGWPDGTALFDNLNLVVGPGRTGLIGANGCGKSTLLKLIAGELRPERGSVTRTGRMAYLPQDIALDADLRVDEVLGIAGIRAALRAIEAGVVTGANLAVVGDRWDAEERARSMLDQLGLSGIGLDRTVGQVSGGEAVLLALAARLLHRPDVLLLDEPTNNLDLHARAALYQAVLGFAGTVVIVSHDRELLDLVDQVAELRDGAVRSYGGNLTAYERAVAAEQEAAGRMVRAAAADVRRQRRDLVETRVKIDRRRRYGRKMETTGMPKAAINHLKKAAQVSAGKLRETHIDRLDRARERLAEAEQAVRDEQEIRIDLPGTAIPAGRTALSLRDVRLRTGLRVSLEVRGPERIALVGGNGAGKTTLLHTIAGITPISAGDMPGGGDPRPGGDLPGDGDLPGGGDLRRPVPLRYLPQRLDLLDDAASVAANVARFAPAASPHEIRARLARFLFRGDRVDALAGTLSGGERFRAVLAALLLAEPPPQLLLLDEPTNSLDLASVRRLVEALAAYRGALIVASHDLPFLRAVGTTRWLRIGPEGLATIDPL